MASHCKCQKCFNSLMPKDSICYECGGRVTPPGCAISAASSIDSEFKFQPTTGNSEPTDATVEDKFYDVEETIFEAPSDPPQTIQSPPNMDKEEFCVEKYRHSHESNTEWNLRRQFILAHRNSFDHTRLMCLASCYVNVECYGCSYPGPVMDQLKELSENFDNGVKEKKRKKT